MLDRFRKNVPQLPHIRDEAKMLALLIENGDKWQKDRHTWYHPTGVTVWTGNLDIGVSVKWNSSGLNDYKSLNDNDAWRANKAEEALIKKAMESIVLNSQRKAIVEVAKRIVSLYGVENLVANSGYGAIPLLTEAENSVMQENVATLAKIKAVFDLVKTEGKILETIGSSADRWELQDIRASMTDAGYGIQISTRGLTAWADLGSNQVGFMRGDIARLNNVVESLKIEL